jgi:hypothetical protein
MHVASILRLGLDDEDEGHIWGINLSWKEVNRRQNYAMVSKGLARPPVHAKEGKRPLL